MRSAGQKAIQIVYRKRYKVQVCWETLQDWLWYHESQRSKCCQLHKSHRSEPSHKVFLPCGQKDWCTFATGWQNQENLGRTKSQEFLALCL